MIELNESGLRISFPEVHEHAVCNLSFQRTLRIPDDNREYPLPPGLGTFPLVHVADFAASVPASWARRGGVMMPMYQSEALWINFSSGGYPFAIKIAAGKINAVTGDPWDNALHEDPQDYVAIPEQPWLDGFCVQNGLIRQFVAMPLGAGYTAEEQLSGTSDIGGIQIVAYPMKRECYAVLQAERRSAWSHDGRLLDAMVCMSDRECVSDSALGLAPGGLMRQQLIEDRFGLEAYDQERASRCFVHLLNSTQWMRVTNTAPPTEPITAKRYTDAGLPWFDYMEREIAALNGDPRLRKLDSVATKARKNGVVIEDNEPVAPRTITQVRRKGVQKVDQGEW